MADQAAREAGLAAQEATEEAAEQAGRFQGVKVFTVNIIYYSYLSHRRPGIYLPTRCVERLNTSLAAHTSILMYGQEFACIFNEITYLYEDPKVPCVVKKVKLPL